MSVAKVDGVTYAYPRAPKPALEIVELEIAEGEFSLVAGGSGGGKSTLLRLFNGLVPQFHGGVISGEVSVAGLDAIRTPTRQLSQVAGMVFQEPEAQSVAETVLEEIAFGMEQRAVQRDEMQRRADRVLADLQIEHLRHRRLLTLSGGERQRVAIASVLALRPKLLLLDEPASQLDAAGSASLLAAVEDLHRRAGLSVLIAEHRLERLIPVVHRVIEVSAARVRTMCPAVALSTLAAVPPAAALFRRLGLPPQLTLESAKSLLPAGLQVRPAAAVSPGALVVRTEGLSVAYGDRMALREVTLELREGEVVALVGPNGSGKTSLFRALTGLVRPAAGTIEYGLPGSGQPRSTREITASIGLVPQDPAIALYRESVRDEIRETIGNRDPSTRTSAHVDRALASWDISEFGDKHPRDISVGQQQRVAIAAMLAHEPKVWLLDEPTRGADGQAKAALAARLRAHALNGGAAIVATHDIESAALFATRLLTLDEGELVSDLPAREAFAATGPHPTQISVLVPGAVTLEEVV